MLTSSRYFFQYRWMIKDNHSYEEPRMIIFGQNPKKQNPDQNSKSENAKTADNIDIAAAEYSYFHVHQIKTWAGWSVNQEEVDYTVDPPLYLNK